MSDRIWQADWKLCKLTHAWASSILKKGEREREKEGHCRRLSRNFKENKQKQTKDFYLFTFCLNSPTWQTSSVCVIGRMKMPWKSPVKGFLEKRGNPAWSSCYHYKIHCIIMKAKVAIQNVSECRLWAVQIWLLLKMNFRPGLPSSRFK